MTSRRAHWLLAASLVATAPALGDYNAISFSDNRTVEGTFYDASTGQLDLIIEDVPFVSFFDFGIPQAGEIRNATFHLSSTFDRVGGVIYGTERVLFRGGAISLTFEHDDGSGFEAYEISGRVQMLTATWSPFGPTFRRLDASCAWVAETVNLPGSNVWPNADKRSSFDSFSIDVPTGPDTWDPTTHSLTERIHVQGTMIPYYLFLCCPMYPGDWDRDCDIDLEDFAWFMRCREDAGLNAAQVYKCLDALDNDYDADVDTDDLPVFIDAMTEPRAEPCEYRRDTTGD